ncbi:MAG: transglutaminase-like domain-containing protein [Bacteroidia bacterium]|nr:transglutaminase-like domain-containing protein [Bacteroidia bacterium]
MDIYLAPTFIIDSDNPLIIKAAKECVVSCNNQIEAAIAMYLFVRDTIRYNPYRLDLRPEGLQASSVLQRDSGYCVEKAVLLAALLRANGIPSRLGFANVRNHIGTQRIEERLGTDVLVFHGYTEIYLNQKWVKATPAFNQELCHKLNVEPLEFNGLEDSVFQDYNTEKKLFMEYLHDYGTFADMPFQLFIDSLKQYYGKIFESAQPVQGGYLVTF